VVLTVVLLTFDLIENISGMFKLAALESAAQRWIRG
jgi:hypothetical protein